MLMLALPREEPTIPRSTIVWTLITVLLLLGGLGAALVALKRAERKAAQQIEKREAQPQMETNSR